MKEFISFIDFTNMSDEEKYNNMQHDLLEIERLNNIINELEKELKDRIKNVPYTMVEVYEDESILDKLQELKGSGSNE